MAVNPVAPLSGLGNEGIREPGAMGGPPFATALALIGIGILLFSTSADAVCNLYQVGAQAVTQDSTTTCADYPTPFVDADYRDNLGGSLLSGSFPGEHMQLAFLPHCVDGANVCLPQDRVRAVDGTRPFLYFDADADADVSRNVVSSDKWVFFFQGGKQCGQVPGFSDPVTPCLTMYLEGSQAPNMSSAFPVDVAGSLGHHYAMSTNSRGGILGDEGVAPGVRGNRFRNYNRVFMYKLSMDAHIGDRENTEVVDVPGQGQVQVRTYHHGRRQIMAAFRLLADSPPVDTNLPGRVTDSNVLPSLRDAEEIIIAAQSMGAFGLVHNIQFIADYLRTQVLPKGSKTRIRFVLDGNFPPSNAVEQEFDDHPFGLYDFRSATQNYAGDSQVQSDRGLSSWTLSRSSAHFSDPTSSSMRALFDSWGRISVGETGDANCVAYFDGSAPHRIPRENWRCYDHLWVLSNFVREDVFVHFNLQDQAILFNDSTYAVDNGKRSGRRRQLAELRSQRRQRTAELSERGFGPNGRACPAASVSPRPGDLAKGHPQARRFPHRRRRSHQCLPGQAVRVTPGAALAGWASGRLSLAGKIGCQRGCRPRNGGDLHAGRARLGQERRNGNGLDRRQSLRFDGRRRSQLRHHRCLRQLEKHQPRRQRRPWGNSAGPLRVGWPARGTRPSPYPVKSVLGWGRSALSFSPRERRVRTSPRRTVAGAQSRFPEGWRVAASIHRLAIRRLQACTRPGPRATSGALVPGRRSAS